MEAVVYSDASYCHKNDISACGFLVIQYQRIIKHQILIVSGLKTPTRADAWALTTGIQYAFLLDGVRHIAAYTDCIAVVRAKTYNKKYTDLTITIEIIQDHQISFKLHHVKGHSTNKYNIMIDKSCNSELRKYLNAMK